MDSPTDSDGFNFSTPLKLRLVAYFRNCYNLDIKDQEADLYLRSLVRVYDALSKEPRLSPPGKPPLVRGDQAEVPSPGVRNTGGTLPNAS